MSRATMYAQALAIVRGATASALTGRFVCDADGTGPVAPPTLRAQGGEWGYFDVFIESDEDDGEAAPKSTTSRRRAELTVRVAYPAPEGHDYVTTRNAMVDDAIAISRKFDDPTSHAADYLFIARESPIFGEPEDEVAQLQIPITAIYWGS